MGILSALIFLTAGAALATETWATDKKTGAKVFWVSNSGGLLTSASWDGPIVNGLAQGTGSFTISVRLNGKDYDAKGQGEMISGYLDGKVILQWSDGDSFDGAYKRGRTQGKGIYSWANGNRYDGDWVEGKISGKGILTWKDGKSYEGEWLDGKRSGQGIMKDPQGKILFEGQWKNDNPVVFGLKTDTVLGIPWAASEKTVKDTMNKRPGTTFWDKGKQKEARRISYFTTYNDRPAVAQIFLYQDEMYWVQVVLQSKTEGEMMQLFESSRQGLSDRYGMANGEMGTGKDAKIRWDLGEEHLLCLRMGKFQTINAAPVFPSVFIDYWYKKTDDIVEKGSQQGNTTDY
jgi:hypothetical protein